MPRMGWNTKGAGGYIIVDEGNQILHDVRQVVSESKPEKIILYQ